MTVFRKWIRIASFLLGLHLGTLKAKKTNSSIPVTNVQKLMLVLLESVKLFNKYSIAAKRIAAGEESLTRLPSEFMDIIGAEWLDPNEYPKTLEFK